MAFLVGQVTLADHRRISKRHLGCPQGTIKRALARKYDGALVVTVVLANKMARIVWALTIRHDIYRNPVAA